MRGAANHHVLWMHYGGGTRLEAVVFSRADWIGDFFPKRKWNITDLSLQIELTLANIGMLTLGTKVLSMVAIAASIGSGISAVMVGVRKAYGGSYSTLLAMQKLSEVSLALYACLVPSDSGTGAPRSAAGVGGLGRNGVDHGRSVRGFRSTVLDCARQGSAHHALANATTQRHLRQRPRHTERI